MTLYCTGYCNAAVYDPSMWILLLITVGAMMIFLALLIWKLNPGVLRTPVGFAGGASSYRPLYQAPYQPPIMPVRVWYWNPPWLCNHERTRGGWPEFAAGTTRICLRCGTTFSVR
jgi:hypothetical protein